MKKWVDWVYPLKLTYLIALHKTHKYYQNQYYVRL